MVQRREQELQRHRVPHQRHPRALLGAEGGGWSLRHGHSQVDGSWQKYQAMRPTMEEDLARMKREGSRIIPMKVTVTIEKLRVPGQPKIEPKFLSRLVTCGDMEAGVPTASAL